MSSRSNNTAASSRRNPGGGTVLRSSPNHASRFVSVKTLAAQWECSRTTVCRLLDEAGVEAYYFGRGRNGSKRYLKDDVERFLLSLEKI